MQKLLEVEKRAAKHGAAAVSIQAAVAQNSGSAEPCSDSESRLVRKDIEFERYISCHCFYLKTKFQIK